MPSFSLTTGGIASPANINALSPGESPLTIGLPKFSITSSSNALSPGTPLTLLSVSSNALNPSFYIKVLND